MDRVAVVTPHVASGRRSDAASCSASMVSSPASPGATIFGPPLKPAKKCGSTKPVVMRRSAATHSRASATGTSSTSPSRTRRRLVARVVVDDPPRASTSGPSISSRSASVLRAVRPGRDQDDDVLVADDAVEDVGDRGELQRAWLGPRDVAHGDRDALARPDEVPGAGDRRPAVDRRPEDRDRVSAGRRCRGTTTVASAGTTMSRPSFRRRGVTDRAPRPAGSRDVAGGTATSPRGRRRPRTVRSRARTSTRPTRGTATAAATSSAGPGPR